MMEDVINRTVYKITGDDVQTLLENIDMSDIANDPVKLGMVSDYIADKLEDIWTEYLPEYLENSIEFARVCRG